MAYTYDDFLSAANKSGMLPEFSQEDLATTQKYPEFGLSLLTLKQDASKASTPEAKLLAQEAESQLRKTYSTVAGQQQAQSSNVGQLPTQGGEEDSGNMPQSSEGSFQYDPETDPRFAAYKKAYLREGDRAAENALAKASVLTGGVPSTAAITASQQAGDYYAGKLADIIPELYSDAYSQHITQQQLQAERDQQKIANALNLYNTLGYATPEVAEILGIPESSGSGGSFSSGLGNSSGSGSASIYGGVKNWDNEGYSQADIMALQNWLGVTPDGLFGPESRAALKNANFNSLAEAMVEQPWNNGSTYEPVIDSGSGSNNYSANQIKGLQKWLGVTQSGTLDPATQNALTAKGYSNLGDAINATPWQYTLSDTGFNFVRNLPMASAGQNTNTWKTTVNERLQRAYESGIVTQSDVITITRKLGL
ncbi:MAG: hypothetical protein ACI3W5_09430 [Faecousia sp.]